MIYKPGDQKIYTHKVCAEDFASFHGKIVHRVYATYAMARDAEWAGRLFVLDMKDETEEGIGTFVHLVHHAPAFEGEEVTFTATLQSINGNEIVCNIEAKSGSKLVATGSTGQKIVSLAKLQSHFERMRIKQ